MNPGCFGFNNQTGRDWSHESQENIMKQHLFGFVLIFSFVFGLGPQPVKVSVSQDTETCLDCHQSLDPGIVGSWRMSRHARVTPAQGLAVKGLASRFSARTVPENLRGTAVGCAECHTLRPNDHKDTFEHNGTKIHLVVTPDDCAVCHADEQVQFSGNLMSHAYGNLVNNGVYQLLMSSINQTAGYQNGGLTGQTANSRTEAESCLYCHGTRLEVRGSASRETDQGEMAFPVIEGWPNQGVGRINPDGSRGSCSACHTRHCFSIEMARKPFTCRECHMGPDVPAYKVYASSKHGNIFSTMNRSWNFDAVPWKIGEDFKAPTCAGCHISLVVNADGDVVSNRTHRMNDRLPWRIFGLIYAHPHPKNPDTSGIRNRDGISLPTDFDGGMANEFLITRPEMENRRQAIQKICLNCHGTSWVQEHWSRFENTIHTTNSDILTGTRIMDDIWRQRFARSLSVHASPFDEAVEKKWVDTWLMIANTIRFASAMSGGGDYGVFEDGRFQLSKTLSELAEWLELKKQLSAIRIKNKSPDSK